MMRALQIAVLGTAALVAAVLGYLVYLQSFGTSTPLVQIGGDFALASSRGGVVDSRDLKGKPYAVFFGFTHCPEVCPTTLYEMSGALTRLGDAARDFRVFFITVDPERDTVEKMRDYIASFDPRMEALVPTMEQLPKLASDFRVHFAKVPTSDGAYTMDHTASVYLMDAEGQFAGTISFGEAPELREAKLRKLLGL
jgi:protein SCO1/2